MLTLRTSRVSNVKRLFCLTVGVIAFVGLGVLPAVGWVTSEASFLSSAVGW